MNEPSVTRSGPLPDHNTAVACVALTLFGIPHGVFWITHTLRGGGGGADSSRPRYSVISKDIDWKFGMLNHLLSFQNFEEIYRN